MAESILYRDHLIVVTAQFNRLAKSWIGKADISYDHNGKRESRQLVGPKYVHSTERAARSTLEQLSLEFFGVPSVPALFSCRFYLLSFVTSAATWQSHDL